MGILAAPSLRVLRCVLLPVVFLSGGGGVREVSLESGTLTAAMVDPEAILVLKGRERVDSQDVRYIAECSVMSV